MILHLKSKQPFKITMTTKDKTEEHTSHPRKLKGGFDHEDNALVIVGNHLGAVEIMFEALAPVAERKTS